MTKFKNNKWEYFNTNLSQQKEKNALLQNLIPVWYYKLRGIKHHTKMEYIPPWRELHYGTNYKCHIYTQNLARYSCAFLRRDCKAEKEVKPVLRFESGHVLMFFKFSPKMDPQAISWKKISLKYQPTIKAGYFTEPQIVPKPIHIPKNNVRWYQSGSAQVV